MTGNISFSMDVGFSYTHTHSKLAGDCCNSKKRGAAHLHLHERVGEHHLYPAEHAGIEDVHASVDLVGYKHLRFFHKFFYLPISWMKHDHSVLGGLLHPCHLEKEPKFFS